MGKQVSKAAPRGFTAGGQDAGTPSQNGGHSPSATGARIITGADRPAVINTVPRMATNSSDGVVTTVHPEDSQGWYRNRDVKQVES
jgi:hypothetical protein